MSSTDTTRARGAIASAVVLLLAGCPSPPTPPAVPGPPPTPGMPSAPNAPGAPQVPPEGEALVKYIPGSGGSGGTYVSCQPPPIEIFIQADAQVNLQENGQSAAVEVRTLLLRERTGFDQLDFESAWQRAKEVLDKQLVGTASLTVYPGKLKIYPIKSAPEVAYVALVAIFRKPEANGWKYVIDVREQNRRCAASDDLHTIVHAMVRGNRIGKPD